MTSRTRTIAACNEDARKAVLAGAFDPTLALDELFATIRANPPKPHDKDNPHG